MCHICPCTCYIIVGGYTIPKNTVVFANVWRFLRDEEYWDQPDQFVPDRFLTPTAGGGGVKVKIPEHFVPFGFGRRVCLGESLAKQEVVLIIVKMVQKMEMRFPPGELPGMEDDVMGLTRNTKPFRVNLVRCHNARRASGSD